MHCNDAGSQDFSRVAESPVPKLLVGPDPWKHINILLHIYKYTSLLLDR